MGFLDSIMGKQDHPQLDPGSAEAKALERWVPQLEHFARKVDDRLELVPAENEIYIFVGKPPKSFGIAWLSPGDEHNLKTHMKEKNLTAGRVQVISDQLRDVYKAHQQAPRYAWQVGGKHVTVTPSAQLASATRGVIHDAVD